MRSRCLPHGVDLRLSASVKNLRLILSSNLSDCIENTRGPASVGFTTVRIELFLDDPTAVHSQGLAAGATERSPVVEHKHEMIGPKPIKRMLQGALVDPFGHMWLIGKIVE